MPSFSPVEVILKKRRGQSLTEAEINQFITAYAKNTLPDYQMAALTMAICFQNMNSQETTWLTQAMKNSGSHFDFNHLNRVTVDKHSTGGIGDKTSMILSPIVATTGIAVPMIAGRGLGHTGGTLDKLESLKGFNVNLSFNEFKKNVNDINLAIMGQTPEICPADRKLYALRDVTGTVDSLPLICSSIMSKKLSEGLNALVLDVKFGSGAFMKSPEQAKNLAQLLKRTGEESGLKVHALLTNMNQPLGRFVGNALEIKECLDILNNKTCIEGDIDFYQNCRELSLKLSAHMIWLGEKAKDLSLAYQLAEEKLTSGEALDKFKQMCSLQGDPDTENIIQAKQTLQLIAPNDGFITQMDCEKIGFAAIEIKAGRRFKDDKIDPSSGFEFHIRLGQSISKGDTLVTLYGHDTKQLENAKLSLLKAITIDRNKPKNLAPLILETLT